MGACVLPDIKNMGKGGRRRRLTSGKGIAPFVLSGICL